jgi:endonuclease YncB( thermonuclease family)
VTERRPRWSPSRNDRILGLGPARATFMNLLPLAALGLLAQPQAREDAGPRPEITVEIVKVVDGDTLDVLLDGEVVPLRLLSVDTEEKLSGRPLTSPTKPQTVFGEETAQWAREFFAALGDHPRIGLAFPEGRRRDVYGRLLCHVLLPDGRDFNLLLVEQGRSPYFNKYGNSLVEHEAFLRAQAAAREARLGIWNPATNRARTPWAPSALRPYGELLPWWDARAAAIDAFRARAAREPEAVFSFEDAAGLERAFELCRADPARRVTVFAAIERFYDEDDGSLTALLRAGDEHTSLRAAVPAGERPALEPWLRASTEEFRQNYLYVTGRMERNRRGLLVTGASPTGWRLADPEYPPPHAK